LNDVETGTQVWENSLLHAAKHSKALPGDVVSSRKLNDQKKIMVKEKGLKTKRLQLTHERRGTF